jgi:hypothetical protein
MENHRKYQSSLLLIVLLLIVFSQSIYGKTYDYLTYMGRFSVDNSNNKVVMYGKDVYNIYERTTNPMKLYLKSANSEKKICIEFSHEFQFNSINLYYFKNNGFEFEANYKIIRSQSSDLAAEIDYRNCFFKSIRSLIIEGEYDNNKSLFESDNWWMKPIETRIFFICQYLIKELQRAKISYNHDFNYIYQEYDIFKYMLQSGKYDKMIANLKSNDIRATLEDLNLLEIDLDVLYYYVKNENRWYNYMYPNQ